MKKKRKTDEIFPPGEGGRSSIPLGGTYLFDQAIAKYAEQKDLAERVEYVADGGGRVDVYTAHL